MGAIICRIEDLILAMTKSRSSAGQPDGGAEFAEADFPSGNAGEVRIKAGSLSVSNGGLISTTASGFGNAGDLTVNAGSLSIDRQPPSHADRDATGV
jgi:adhesin HecA-like repeat protein